MSDHGFLALPELLEPGDLVVVNETRVRAARLIGRRTGTGGRVEIFLLERRDDGVWTALARPMRRLRPGTIVEFDGMSATVVGTDSGLLQVTLSQDDEQAISAIGEVPLPPYFTGTLDNAERYQTIFARSVGSAAAPTAGLHFTREVLAGLEARGISVVPVDLHVSLDTFRPMKVENVEEHEMHTELCVVPADTARAIGEVRERGRRVVAIGTTVVRTLESMADGEGGVSAGSLQTGLFLRPGSEFTVVDALVTNFHLPRSTLLVLLAAFMGDSWREAYAIALRRGYRFLSFGDAMFAERAG